MKTKLTTATEIATVTVFGSRGSCGDGGGYVSP